MLDDIESRLERLAATAAAEEAPALDESGEFLATVRRRGRVRALRSVMIAGAGVSLAAAGVLLAALLNPPRLTPVPAPAIVADISEPPTIGMLSRAAWEAEDPSDMPAFPVWQGGGLSEEAPLSAGAIHSRKVRAELLGGV